MENSVIEANYPLAFRKEDATPLGAHLKDRHSVVLIGMKRVGISNFLRFFLNHKDIVKTYIGDGNSHFFVAVDLNDLVERDIFPFWILTLKRISDSVEKSGLDKSTKQYVEKLFLDCMQSKDIFSTIEGVRRSVVRLVEKGILPTLFFIRFDRMKDIVSPEFFANLQGLRDATHHKLSYVFTSFRSLDELSPTVFTKASLSVFSKDLYIKPAKEEYTEIIFNTYKEHYKLKLSFSIEQALFELVDGYVQYLQLSLAYLHERKGYVKTKDELFENLSKDERIMLQSEELWESLGTQEKSVLTKIIKNEIVTLEEKDKAGYLWDTGFVVEKNNKPSLFSPLFEYYIRQTEKKLPNSVVELTKKENLLFNFLKDNFNAVCEREQIINKVWPEVEVVGVSDWAIDRLIARVRNKLKLQKSQFEIQTIRTRGYKLIEV